MNAETLEAIDRLWQAVAGKKPVKTFLANEHTASVVEVMPRDILLACAAVQHHDTNTDALKLGCKGGEESLYNVYVNVADLMRMLQKIDPPPVKPLEAARVDDD